MTPILSNLPIGEVLPRIRESLHQNSRLILQAPPGAGKTTAVPLSLLNEPWLEGKKILMLQPRRLAARTAAVRMAELLGEEIGKRVGYHIRGERKSSKQTKVLVITEGILTRYLQSDPGLEEAALVIFDEFHERNLHSDLSLAFALQSQEVLREDLKLLVMSATLDTRGLGELLENPPILSSEGRSYPVEFTYLSPTATSPSPREIVAEAHKTLLTALQNDEGDILVFLPGEREIRELESRLADYAAESNSDLLIVPLYGNLSKEEQHRAILPAPKRKIVLATNIAETSLTIEGIRIVVDTGFERVSCFDPHSGMERLVTQRISRASADQRAGRSGRTAPGRCYRLWSEYAHHTLPPHRPPDILTADLTPLALELAGWGSDGLRWIDPPAPAALSHARELLAELGALEEGSITPHGRALLAAPLHPRLAHMIERSVGLGQEGEAILLAALLSDRDILRAEERHSDLFERFWILREAIVTRRTPPHLHTLIQNVREISARTGKTVSFVEDPRETLPLLLSFAYPDRIARARGGGKFLTSGGKEVFLPPSDPLAKEEWLVVARSDGKSTSARVHLALPASLDLLRLHHSETFGARERVAWNPKEKRVEARVIERLGAITLSERPLATPDPEQIKTALLEGFRIHGLDAVWDEPIRSLQHRLVAFGRHRPQLCGIDFSDAALLEHLEEWLLPHLGPERSLEECKNLKWETILLSALSWESRHELERLLPGHFTAPTGSRIEIDYTDPGAPVLPVRIQEMFGTSIHPAVLSGELPLTIHLLSPAQRPIQVTRDLTGFWSGSYAEVKKELRGRYPKHFWPDDPATAQATKKTKKYMDSQAAEDCGKIKS